MSHPNPETTDNAQSSFILILGVAGSGRSSFIRGLIDDKDSVPIGCGIWPQTTSIQQYAAAVDDESVILVDTPGMDSSDSILNDLQEWMGTNAISFDAIRGIVFLQPINMNRINMSIIMRILDKFVGRGEGNLYRRIVLSTSMWNQVPQLKDTIHTEREDLLRRKFWSALLNQGAMVQRYDGSPNSARDITRSILQAHAPDRGDRPGIREIPKSLTHTSPSPEKDKSTRINIVRKRFTWLFKSISTSYAGKFVIALLGPTGTGKSSFVAKATNKMVDIGSTMDPCTNQIGIYETRLSDTDVVLVDTPGYDVGDNGQQVLNLLREWRRAQNFLRRVFGRQKVNFNSVLFFYRMPDPILEPTRAYVRTFSPQYSGNSVVGRVHLVTTFWNEVNEAEGQKKNSDLGSLWRVFGSNSYRFDLHKSPEEATSAAGIVKGVLSKGSVGCVPFPSTLLPGQALQPGEPSHVGGGTEGTVSGD